jgi:CheY-like chemotaxis protein
MRVMLIDDSEADRLYTRIVLERSGLGCQVIAFESARDALAHLQEAGDEEDVQLILLDINMPGMDGFEFLEAWDSTPAAAARTAVAIMLSSSPHPADTERARRQARVRGYITKPIDREQALGLARYIAP